MINLLPEFVLDFKPLLLSLFHKAKGLLSSKRVKYKLAALVDIALIALILINGRQPLQSLTSPMASSLHSFSTLAATNMTNETFTFVPDLAQNKFGHIDLEHLTYLSFFDLPLTEEGLLNYNSRGYSSFTSDEASILFERARANNTKIFLTISALDEDIIKNLLDNPDTQAQLADQIAEEIRSSNLDGVTLDFEPFRDGKNINLPGYQEKFTKFVELIKNKIHSDTQGVQLAVAVPSTFLNKSFYDVSSLSKASDKVFLVAANFIVPEVRNASMSNPVFGFNWDEYKGQVTKVLTSLVTQVHFNQLVMERAWYGNGDKYPLYYVPNDTPPERNRQASNVQLDDWSVDQLISGVPDKGKPGARKAIPLIAQALEDEGILDSNVLAYALGTIEHETDETFEPIEEIAGAVNARRFGYEGGANYFGRGFIQITHLRNYRQIGRRIGLGDQLVKNPDLALKPKIAAKILAAFFKDNNVANLASKGQFVAARRPVNPDYNGYSIASLAMKYDLY